MIWSFTLLLAIVLIAAAVAWLVGERGRLVLPATRRVLREWPSLSIWRLRSWHFYVYGRWPRLYIGALLQCVFGILARCGRRGRRWLADRYHGKVLTPEHARSLLTVNKTIAISDLDRVVPYPRARTLLLQHPLDIVAFECPCRMARVNHCHPTQVCLIVGQPFAGLVLDHHPRTSRRLPLDEALELLAAEHRRGHVHVAWFKDVCLDRFFAICNCCRCCCAGIEAMLRYGMPMMTSSGLIAANDPELCTGCGTCQKICVFQAVRVNAKAHVDSTRCMGCGVCVGHCPAGAMQLQTASDKSPPLDLGTFTG